MGGGLMQLVAYGAQDVYLTGNPQITFFKVVYRRHTNFAIEAIEQTFNGSPSFGSKSTVQITRNGDLVLEHVHDGRDLDLEYAEEVVQRVKTLWPRDVKFFTIPDCCPSGVSCASINPI